MDVSIVIPAYNEEKSVKPVIAEIKKVLSGFEMTYEIILVDDGSTDKTAEAAAGSGVKIVRHERNRGYGRSLKDGIHEAAGDVIVITDADGTYPPSAIPELLKYISKYDMVVGARTGTEVSMPFMRRAAKFFLRALANYLTGTKIPDLNSGLRVFRKKEAEKYFKLISDGFSFTTTVTLAYLVDGLSVKFMKINYAKRTGESKIRPLADTYNFLILIIRTIIYFNPLKVLLPLSFITGIAGFLILLYSMIFLKKVMDITVIVTLLASMQIAVLAFIADLIVKRGD